MEGEGEVRGVQSLTQQCLQFLDFLIFLAQHSSHLRARERSTRGAKTLLLSSGLYSYGDDSSDYDVYRYPNIGREYHISHPTFFLVISFFTNKGNTGIEISAF